MSTATPAAAGPPDIAGFEFRRVLGVGGFSTVYLYEQLRPRREVAIKVLATDMLNEESQRRFEVEANLMAELSAHPYIVTIYDADFTSDGRPFLVMEYYPGPNLGVRSRNERIGVAEVLQLGIQISSAVETAHRAGIVHRDIKPANILTSRYHRPGLTDFGISVSTAVGEHEEGGMSVPWSPPEAFDTSAVLDVRSDIYSLGALVYNLLTGRSPFEVPGEPNDAATLEERIRNGTPSPIDREDVPAELERALLQSMSKRPDLRPSSAVALARAFQAVEQDLSLPPSQIDILDSVSSLTVPVAAVAGELAAEPTRLRGSTLDSRGSRTGAATSAAGIGAASSGVAAAGAQLDPDSAHTVMRTTPPKPNSARICPQCGIAIAAEARFCGSCGIDITTGGNRTTSLASAQGSPGPAKTAAVTSAAAGATIASTAAASASTPSQVGGASDTRRRNVIAGAAAGLVLLLVVGVAVAVVGSSSGSTPTTPAPVAATHAPATPIPHPSAAVKPTAKPKPKPPVRHFVPRPVPKPKPVKKPTPKAPVDPADLTPHI